MGILDKIMFWKKKDDLSDLGDLGGGLGKDNLAFGDNFNAQGAPFGQQGLGQNGMPGMGNDFGQGMGQGLGQGLGTSNYGQPPAQSSYGQ